MYNQSGVLGSPATTGVLGVSTGSAATLPFTGVSITLVWLVLAGVTAIALGIMLLRLGKLVSGEAATQSGVFLR